MNSMQLHAHKNTLAFFGLLLSCAGHAACKKEGHIAPEPAASSLAQAQNSAGSAERAPAAETASAPTHAPPQSALAEIPKSPALTFYRIAQGPADLIKDADFLPGKESALWLFGGSAYEIQGDLFVNAHSIFASLKPFRSDMSMAGRVEGYGGRWPDAAYAEIQWNNERATPEGRIYDWDGASFNATAYLGAHNHLMAAGTASKGLIVASITDPFAPKKSINLQSTRLGIRYELEKAPDDAPCETRMGPVEEIAVTPKDEAFVRGLDCKSEKYIIESFGADGKSKGVAFIPEVFQLSAPHKGERPPILSMYAAASDALYVAGVSSEDPSAKKPLLMRLNGKNWSKEKLPAEEGSLDSLSGNSSGMLIATIDGTIWQKPSPGNWSKVALPGDAKAIKTWATDGFIYALGLSDQIGILFRSKAARHVAQLGDPGPEKPFVPATPECKTPFVVMYRVTDNVGPDYDFPLTRKALDGHGEFEGIQLVVTAHSYFGASVPTLEMGEKLLSLIKEKVKGSKPQLVCLEPTILRDIPIDLKAKDPAPANSK